MRPLTIQPDIRPIQYPLQPYSEKLFVQETAAPPKELKTKKKKEEEKKKKEEEEEEKMEEETEEKEKVGKFSWLTGSGP